MCNLLIIIKQFLKKVQKALAGIKKSRNLVYWVERETPHIKKKLYMNNKMTNQFTDVAYNTARNERPVYINFSATKLSNAVKPNTIVEFTDFMGKKHKVVCRNKPEMKKACEFFSMLKRESTFIKMVLNDYPMYATNKKQATMVRRELKQYLNLNTKQIDNILLMNIA